MSTDDFSEFMKQRKAAAHAYVNGDASAVARLVARAQPASFFGPLGGGVNGAHEVAARYERDVAAFTPGGETQFEILHSSAGGDLAYWVGHQRATARMRGSDEPVQFDLRITEIYRREDGEWKLIHRHADPLSREAERKP